ncbi:MAG TPA: hypothetical protein VF041_03260 [Gemmatimonadaceae bacterium]
MPPTPQRSAPSPAGDTLPTRWRLSRDATHTVVELDLGWTRRLVFTVRHGDARAETVVRHSVLGGRVVKG